MQQLQDFYASIGTGLKDKLGAVLFQMHPAMHFDERKLEQIIKSIDPPFANVLELRLLAGGTKLYLSF